MKQPSTRKGGPDRPGDPSPPTKLRGRGKAKSRSSKSPAPERPPGASPPAGGRGGQPLEFLVIGAQRSGTTSLWKHLSEHPDLYLPPGKEIPYFSHNLRYKEGIDWYLNKYFKSAPEGSLRGTVSPHYMTGTVAVQVPEVAERIHAHNPDIRLIAILRDPLERALSEYGMMVSSKREKRPFAEAVQKQLEPERLEEARRVYRKIDNYVTNGEYGRILSAFLRHFPRSQLLVVFTDDLEQRPTTTVAQVYEHIGVDPKYVPVTIGERFHQGGKRRISSAEEAGLQEFLTTEALPLLGEKEREQVKHGFNFWFRSWNVRLRSAGHDMDEETRSALRAHYRADAALLARLLLPWPWAVEGDDAMAPSGASREIAEPPAPSTDDEVSPLTTSESASHEGARSVASGS